MTQAIPSGIKVDLLHKKNTMKTQKNSPKKKVSRKEGSNTSVRSFRGKIIEEKISEKDSEPVDQKELSKAEIL